jgi:hypothetical protein
MSVNLTCGRAAAGQCDVCDSPLDSRPFDISSVGPAPQAGDELVLAHYTLQPTHCGMLSYFAQFTDLHAKDPSRIHTSGYLWEIRADAQPLDPYLTFEHIINPWGSAPFPVDIRLGEGVTIELVVRNIGASGADVLTAVGGRIGGRHWYDTRFGGAPRLL